MNVVTAYLIDKGGFEFLWQMLGGKARKIPVKLIAGADDNKEEILKKLSDVGYIYIRDNKIDVERTIAFLIGSMIECTDVQSNENRSIFRCERLIIAAENDRHSPKKMRLIPFRSEKDLEKYIEEENENEPDNG